MILFGPDISKLREVAKQAAMHHFVRLASQDGVPATLRAMYVRKAEQAQLVVAGGTSPLIAGEAAVRGITELQMAQVILSMAAQGGDEVEVERMRTNVAIEGAQTPDEIVAILHEHGISMRMDAATFELVPESFSLPLNPHL